MSVVKNIVIMYDFFSEPGGVERTMLFQGKTLKRLGFCVTFAFAYVDKTLAKEYLLGFNVIEYGALLIKNETLQICASVLRKKSVMYFKEADLIICHSFPASYTALRIKKEYGVPFLLNLHHPPQFLYNTSVIWAANSFKRLFSFIIGKIARPVLKKFDRYCVEQADGYMFAGKAVQRVINQTYSNIKGSIIYPAIDERFHEIDPDRNVLQKYGIDGDYILCSGRIVRQKRFDYAIEAFSKLGNCKGLQLVFIGQSDPKEKKRLEEICRRKKLTTVRFLGPLPFFNLVSFYSYSRVTLLTCPKEWFGLVPVEAMSCGCPVVAWNDNFGPEETVIPGVSGYLAEPYDVDDFAEKIQVCLSSHWDKSQIIASSDRFSETRMAIKFARVVGNIIRHDNIIDETKATVH